MFQYRTLKGAPLLISRISKGEKVWLKEEMRQFFFVGLMFLWDKKGALDPKLQFVLIAAIGKSTIILFVDVLVGNDFLSYIYFLL